MKHEDTILELERILEQVNTKLKEILPDVKKPSFIDSDVRIRKAVHEAERLSRWKRGYFESDVDGLKYAIEKAKLKAKEYGEPFIVAADEARLVLVPKARFLKDKPFGLGPKDVVFETGKSGKEKA